MKELTNMMIISSMPRLTQTFKNHRRVYAVLTANNLIFRSSDHAMAILLYTYELKDLPVDLSKDKVKCLEKNK